MTKLQILEILNNCSFVFFDVRFNFVVNKKGDGYLLQCEAFIPCNITGDVIPQKSGKIYLSSHCTKSEIVFKAWQVCKSFIEHEARESFTYKDVELFHPHQDVEELAEYISKSKPDYRKD